MPLKYTKPSSGFANIIERVTPGGSERAHSDYSSHKVYTINSEDIESGAGLDAAKHVGWRIFHSGDSGAVIESYCNENDEEHEFGGVNQGPFVAGTRDVISLAEELISEHKDEYEVAMVRIPWLYVMALWLKSDDAEKDMVIPFGPLNVNLEGNKAYSRAEFVAQLQAAAKKKAEFKDPFDDSQK